MKKIILIFLTLLMCIACRKAEEIKESVTSPSVVNKTAVSIDLYFNGEDGVFVNDTLSQHLNRFEAEITYSDNSTSTFTPTEAMLSGWDSSTVQDITVTVTKDGLTNTVDISIIAKPKTITSIDLQFTFGFIGMIDYWDLHPEPDFDYAVTETVLQYFQLYITYSDGTNETITPTLDMLSGWINNMTNDPITSDITATFGGFTDTLSVDFGANG